MRNLLTRAISGFVFATAIAGSASAAGVTYSSHPQPAVKNSALQAQLDRDDSFSEPWLRRSPLGQVIVPGSTQSAEVPDKTTEARAGHMHLSHDN